MSANGPQRVLITGANGFIGARLCRRFIDEGYEVYAMVRETSDLTLLDGVEVIYRYGDVCQPESLPEIVAGVDYIVHNAGLVKAKKRETFLAVNKEGTRNLFQAIEEHNPDVRRVVYISTLAVAGPSQGRPVRESDPPNPITTYGESKAAGETVALSYAEKFPVVSVRPPGVYGPGDKEMFTLFQTVYRRLNPKIGDTSRKLQLVHVDDLCRGIFLATTKDTTSGSIYFIAEKKAYTVADMMAIFQRGCGRSAVALPIPAPVFKGISAVSELAFKLVGATPMVTREKSRELLASWEIDTSKAKEELGFESKIPLEQGVRETYSWYKEHGWL